MLVPANACRGKKLEDMFEASGISLGLLLAELFMPKEKDVEEFVSGLFGQA